MGNFPYRLILFIIYTMTYFITLFINGVFWDDSGVIGSDAETIMTWHKMAGLPWIGLLITALSKVGLVYYHIFSFIAFFLTGICLDYLLRQHKELFGAYERFFLVGFFLIFPVFTERILVIIGWYTIPNLLFFVGWLLVALYFKSHKRVFRLLSLVFLFLSFSHNAFLFYYSLILVYIAYCEFTLREVGIKEFLLKRLIKYTDYIFIPIIAFIIQSKFKSYGLYEGYNSLSFDRLVNGFQLSLRAINNSFIEVLLSSMNSSFIMVISFIVSFIIYYFFRNLDVQEMRNPFTNMYKQDTLLLLFGLLALFVGVYPYSAVGKVAEHVGWHGRWQLLISLGAAFTIFYGSKLILNMIPVLKSKLLIFQTILMILFMGLNIQFYIDYQRDFFKQMSFIENIEKSKTVLRKSTFIIEDTAVDLNAKERDLNFYEYNYLMKSAFGNANRLALPSEKNYEVEDLLKYKNFKNYHFYQYKPAEPEATIKINKGKNSIKSNGEVLKLTYYYYFNKKRYRAYINDVITLNIKEIK